MHSDSPHFIGNPLLPCPGQAGIQYHAQNASMTSVFPERVITPGIMPLFPPFHGVDVHPSDACPKNFVIFDQANNRSQILYHPALSSKYDYSGFAFAASTVQENLDQNDGSDNTKIASTLKEDSADIDALLSSDYEDIEEVVDDDTLSTARTDAIYECNSPDSCSNYESQSSKSKSRSHFRKPSASRCNEKKRERVRKMVKILRGIVPGANRMSTVAVLNEAVRYLKSLRVDVQKRGVGNSKD